MASILTYIQIKRKKNYTLVTSSSFVRFFMSDHRSESKEISVLHKYLHNTLICMFFT